jgi:hypothetical protein
MDGRGLRRGCPVRNRLERQEVNKTLNSIFETKVGCMFYSVTVGSGKDQYTRVFYDYQLYTSDRLERGFYRGDTRYDTIPEEVLKALAALEPHKRLDGETMINIG